MDRVLGVLVADVDFSQQFIALDGQAYVNLNAASLDIAPVAGILTPNCFELSVLATAAAVILRLKAHVRSIQNKAS